MSKNPADVKDFEAMKDLAHYWMHKSYIMYVEKKALQALLDEHGVQVTSSDLIRKMNEVSKQETARWEKENRSKKK